MTNWKEKAREDFARANQAQTNGNQGLARVCARRAAGWAATAYITQMDQSFLKSSGFQNIKQLRKMDLATKEVQSLIDRLTSNLEVETSSGEEAWPENLDLIADAYRLVAILFPTANLD